MDRPEGLGGYGMSAARMDQPAWCSITAPGCTRRARDIRWVRAGRHLEDRDADGAARPGSTYAAALALR